MGTRISATPTPSEIKRSILEDIPRPLLERTVRCVYGSCRAAELLTKPFPRQIRRDLFPYVRRAFIERDWKALAADFPDVKATFRPNKKKTSNYVKLMTGSVVLTESHVNYPGSLPAPAAFRQGLAADNQMHLFRKNESPRIYAILTYGSLNLANPEWGNPKKSPKDSMLVTPTFMHLVVPSPDYNRHVIDPIDLMSEFSGVIASVDGGPIEEIANETLVSIEMMLKNRLGNEEA